METKAWQFITPPPSPTILPAFSLPSEAVTVALAAIQLRMVVSSSTFPQIPPATAAEISPVL
jgi:hypothetical protein